MNNVAKFIVKLFRFKRILKVVAVEFENYGKQLNILVGPCKNGCRCPVCGRRCEIVCILQDPRYWRDIPAYGIEVFLVFTPREIECPTHGRLQEQIPWADEFSRITYRFEYALLRYAQKMTQKAAAELLKIPQSTFSDMKRRIITRERTNHKIKGLSVLGVDEISYAKGHKYATVVYDLVKAKVVWVGEGKGKDTLNKFFKEHLSEYQRDKIEYACCDMSRAYISSIKTWLTKAKLIIDRFHMVKALNEAMDEVRKEEWRKVQEVDKNALKGLRWMLFRHSSTRSKEETKTIIDKVRVSNNRIYRAWLLKDEFESFWEYSYVGSAEKFLKRWITRALRSRLEPIRKFAKTLREHKDYILPYIDTGITNAKGEGINRLLQLLKNRSSGFMNLEAYKDMIYLLVGDVDIPARIPERFRTI